MFKTTKSKIIFVAIFSIISIIITIMLILYKNIDIEQKEEINPEITSSKQKDVLGIDLDGTYNQNDIELEEKVISKDKIEIKYLQINGLKNKDIQNAINQELEYIALNIYKEKIPNLDEVVNISVNMWNSGNFSNTLSFYVDYYAKINDNSDDFYYEQKGINYDLNTGEKITIDKLFTSDAPIEDILRRSSYYSLIQNLTTENLNGDIVINDYGEIEEEIAKIIKLYKTGKITEFYYTPVSINMIYNENESINIKMSEYAEYIAIYNRYLTDEEIYEENNIGLKNLYTLSVRYGNIDYYTNYQKDKNYFIDISIRADEKRELTKNILNEKIKNIETEIEKLKEMAQKNENNFYILNYYIYAYTIEDGETNQTILELFENGNSYEMTVHDFEENIEPIIVEYNRQEIEGEYPSYVYNFTEKLKIEPQETKEYYNLETGEKVVV